jgi:hypothetical protein
MTFLEAALEILRREGRALHYKELTERAMGKKMLTFVGRTPEVTMQTQLTAAVKKAPGSPFVRVKPGVFGLLRYPELTAEEREAIARAEQAEAEPARKPARPAPAESKAEGDARGGRRRRRGRGRGERETAAPAGVSGATAIDSPHGEGDDGEVEEPAHGGLSAEARAAALAETGVLEGDDHDADDHDDQGPEGPMEDDDRAVARVAGAAHEGDEAEGPEEGQRHRQGEAAEKEPSEGSPALAGAEDDGDDLGEDSDEGEEGPEGPLTTAGGEAAPGVGGDAPGRRRRRRRRRGGRGGEGFGDTARGPDLAPRPVGDVAEGIPSEGAAAPELASAGGEPSAPRAPMPDPGPRKIMTPVDAALEILRARAPGRGVHVREIADAAARQRLVHGEPNEAWRVMRTALAAEPRERLRAGQRPRVRAAGAGLYALARRPPDQELERAEQVFGEARRALRERTLAALERRIADLPASAFEALGRVLLQREGFGPATFVKRVDGTIYVEALRGRGSRPSKCLVGLRFGPSTAGLRAIGELRAGIEARGQDEGLLMLGGRMAEDGVAAWKKPGPPVEIADGAAMAETCVRHGVGVINTMVSVDFVDADFFADIAEG